MPPDRPSLAFICKSDIHVNLLLKILATDLLVYDRPKWEMFFLVDRVRNKSTGIKSRIQLGFEPKNF